MLHCNYNAKKKRFLLIFTELLPTHAVVQDDKDVTHLLESSSSTCSSNVDEKSYVNKNIIFLTKIFYFILRLFSSLKGSDKSVNEQPASAKTNESTGIGVYIRYLKSFGIPLGLGAVFASALNQATSVYADGCQSPLNATSNKSITNTHVSS